jgi:hypothetical protein
MSHIRTHVLARKSRAFRYWSGSLFWLAILVVWFAYCTAASAKPTSTFRWITPKTDPQTWAAVQDSFRDELVPDDPHKEAPTYAYKYISHVALLDRVALVIVVYRTVRATKGQWVEEYFTAFNFDVATGARSKIPDAEWMWNWNFVKLANFESSPTPDIVFTYLTCSECEPERMLSALYYDGTSEQWRLREWQNRKDVWWTTPTGLVVWQHVSGGNGIAFDCLYAIKDLNGDRFDDIAIRCKEVSESEAGKIKANDAMVIYSVKQGKFTSKLISNWQERVDLTSDLCALKPANSLCKLRRYMTDTSQPIPPQIIVPKAPRTARQVAQFGSLKRGMSMADVVRICGVPDEHQGSGVYIFVYYMEDGSIVTIGTSDLSRIDDVIHVDKAGRASSLLPEK